MTQTGVFGVITKTISRQRASLFCLYCSCAIARPRQMPGFDSLALAYPGPAAVDLRGPVGSDVKTHQRLPKAKLRPEVVP